MSSFKKLKTSDIITVPATINKEWSLTSVPYPSSSDGFTIYKGKNITGSFDPNGPVTEGEYEKLMYDFINHTFYQQYSETLNTHSLMNSLYYESASQDRLVEGYQNVDSYNIHKQFPTESGDIIRVFSINQGLYGNTIQPTKFAMSGSDYYIVDDGYGNLWDVKTYLAQIGLDSDGYLDAETSTMSVSGTILVGNIFYSHGLATITNQNHLWAYPTPPNAVNRYFKISNVQVSKSLADISQFDYIDSGSIDFNTFNLETADGYLFPTYTTSSVDNINLPSQTDLLEVTPGVYKLKHYVWDSDNILRSNKADVTLELYSDDLEAAVANMEFGEVDLSFTYATNVLSEANKIWTIGAASVNGYGNIGVGNQTLASGNSGRIISKFPATMGNVAMMLQTTNAGLGWTSFLGVGIIVDPNNGDVYAINSGTFVILGSPRQIGYYYCLYRDGVSGACYLQESLDKQTWTTLYTFAFNSTAILYSSIDVYDDPAAVNHGKLDTPIMYMKIPTVSDTFKVCSPTGSDIVSLHVNYGVPPYSYALYKNNIIQSASAITSWYQPTQSLGGIVTGSYILQVTDREDSISIVNFNVKPKIDITVNTDYSNTTYNHVVFTASNGVTPYTYSLTSGSTVYTASGANSYIDFNNVTINQLWNAKVVDNNGCYNDINTVVRGRYFASASQHQYHPDNVSFDITGSGGGNSMTVQVYKNGVEIYSNTRSSAVASRDTFHYDLGDILDITISQIAANPAVSRVVYSYNYVYTMALPQSLSDTQSIDSVSLSYTIDNVDAMHSFIIEWL